MAQVHTTDTQLVQIAGEGYGLEHLSPAHSDLLVDHFLGDARVQRIQRVAHASSSSQIRCALILILIINRVVVVIQVSVFHIDVDVEVYDRFCDGVRLLFSAIAQVPQVGLANG